MKILLVDHVIGIRNATRAMLTAVGFRNVKEAGDGESAWSIIEEGIATNEKIELIISEWSLPKLTGKELLERIRANPSMKAVPFLLATGEAEQQTIVTAIKSGANNFIVKPYSSQTLQEKIAEVFQKIEEQKSKKKS
ncbi:MAG: response regulator [Bdellovibrio sp.]|nr:response regulator [Bdellovibrio sp.]